MEDKKYNKEEKRNRKHFSFIFNVHTVWAVTSHVFQKSSCHFDGNTIFTYT